MLAQIRRVAEVYVSYNLWTAAKDNLYDKEELAKTARAKMVEASSAQKPAADSEYIKAEADVTRAKKARNEAAVRLEAARRQPAAANGASDQTSAEQGGARRGERDPNLQPVVAEVTVVVRSAPNFKVPLLEQVKNLSPLVLFLIYKYVLFGWLWTPDADYSSRDRRSMTELTSALGEARRQRRILAAKIAQSTGRGVGSWFSWTDFGRVRRHTASAHRAQQRGVLRRIVSHKAVGKKACSADSILQRTERGAEDDGNLTI